MLYTRSHRRDQLGWEALNPSDELHLLNYDKITNEACLKRRRQALMGTGSTPRVKTTIGEHNFRSSKILFIGNSTKMVQSEIIVRSDFECIIAEIRVSSLVKATRIEHIFDSISTHGHSLVTTG